MSYEIIDNITMADIAFRITGADLNELFTSAAHAVMSVMTENWESISPDVKKTVKLEGDSLDLLFFNFLQEIIFFKDSESLFLLPGKIIIEEGKNKYRCTAELQGEAIDSTKHDLGVDIKAITMHNFELKKEKDRWTATVVLDV